jgi:hypothetical protein
MNNNREEKRAYPRKSSNLYARLYCGEKTFTAVVTNISKNGMRIKSSKRLPIMSKSQIFIPLIQVVLKSSIKIVRLIRTDDVYYGMGVQVLHPKKDYLNLVEDLKHY